MRLPQKCPHCGQDNALTSMMFGGPWLLYCGTCPMEQMKFGFLHHQYLFKVMVRAGLSKGYANAAVADEVTRDGFTCFPVPQCVVADTEDSQKMLKGPVPRIQVSGKLTFALVKDEEGNPLLDSAGSGLGL